MSPATSRAAASIVVFCALAACPASKSPPPAPKRGGMHVPLPDGWTARMPPEGGLRAGPLGRTVLRVDVRPAPAPGEPLLSPLSLAEQFSQENKTLRVTVTSEVADKDLSMVVLEVSRAAMRARAMLGLKRIGTELFLCATEPGSREDEVQDAAEACQGLSALVGGDT